MADAGGSAAVKAPVKSWGPDSDGKEVHIYQLKAANGATAEVSTFGAALVTLFVPDADGKLGDVTLGFDNYKSYEDHDACFGGTVGRYANRICKGRFTLDGVEYQLPTNDGPNCLHGGRGFHRHVWEVTAAGEASITLRYESQDMEEGFPGKLAVTVTYVLSAPGGADGKDVALEIRYTAATDKTTVVNLTNHAYFNLNGHDGEASRELPSVLDHTIAIAADSFTVVDERSIPTGELRSVEGTPLDLRALQRIGENIDADYDQNRFGIGFDHNWILRPTQAEGPRSLGVVGDAASGLKKARHPDAVLSLAATGRQMEVFTTEPGVQLYTGNYLGKGPPGKYGYERYGHRTGVCLETQHFADSPNHENFPSTRLEPGQIFESATVYWFSAQK